MRLVSSSLLVALAFPLAAQDPIGRGDDLGRYGRVVQSWIGLRVAPGREAPAIASIRHSDGEWRLGPLGSLVQTRGTGYPHRVVACGLDEPSYIVSHVTDDGYLRVHVAGARARHPGWDAWHVGQRVVVLTSDHPGTVSRAVPGVFAVRSTHLWRRTAQGDGPPTLEDLWLDVGARNRAQVAALGIDLMDPVFRDAPDWSVGDAVVGPYAAARAGCVAVAAAAGQEPMAGRTTYVISTHSSFNWAGLHAVVRGLGDVDSVFVAHPAAPRSFVGVAAESRFTGTLVETMSEEAVRDLFIRVAQAAATELVTDPSRLRLTVTLPRTPFAMDSIARDAELLARLADTYGVSGDEGGVAEVIRNRLPAWARDSVTTDTAGNVILAFGPDRDTTVFIAHMDEVGFEIVSREGDVFTLRQLGGFYPWLFSGQVALMHGRGEALTTRAQGCRPTSGDALRGVFLPPDTTARDPRQVRAWFGEIGSDMDMRGLRVTSFKCSTRLATTRFTARGIDDRVGSAALILALAGVNRAALKHKLVFVWSTREETGLAGARAVAAQFGTSVLRVHTVDTFVSADSPLETGRFAVAPIGAGAIVRVVDNASVVPPAELQRVQRIARSANVPLQVGTTNGGTDGSAFVPYGAPNVAISWPARYSHSPVELIDLGDMRALVRLITALANAPVR